MVQLSLSYEDKLLLYCSRLSIDIEISQKIEEILSSELDWNYIVDCSVKQGITSLFYWNLRKITTGKQIPSEILQKLEKMYYSNLARNVIYYDELHRVLTAFKKVNIDTIVLKGVFLAEEIYKNVGLRSMGDADLLIKEKDLKQVRIELTKLRYSEMNIFPTRLHEQLHRIKSGETTFISKEKNTFIDIHWDIQPCEYTYKLDVNKFWDNAKPIKIANIETLTFACEDILQHLCLHVDKHITLSSIFSYEPPAKPLRDYCDISEVIKYYNNMINWDYILQSSKNYGIEKPVYQGLSIAKTYFGAFVPGDVLTGLKPIESITIGFEEIYREAMTERHEKENKYDETVLFTDLKMIDGCYNKAYFVFRGIFPSKKFMMHYYSIDNENQVYIYYLTRFRKSFQSGLNTLHQLPRYLLESTFNK